MQGLGVPFINDLNILYTASGTNLEKYLNVMLFIELEFFLISISFYNMDLEFLLSNRKLRLM